MYIKRNNVTGNLYLLIANGSVLVAMVNNGLPVLPIIPFIMRGDVTTKERTDKLQVFVAVTQYLYYSKDFTFNTGVVKVIH